MNLSIFIIPILMHLPINGIFALDSTSGHSKYTQDSFMKKDQLISRTRSLMGTYVTISLPPDNNRQISSSFDLIQKIEDALSSYAPNAALSRLNKTHKVEYNDFLAESIALSKSYYLETDGFFDITIGSISKKLYQFGEEKTYSPSKEELAKAHMDIDGINVDKHTIQSDKNIVLDLGGMGKGYAVDKVVSYLKEQNISKGIIALSGDIQCINVCDIYLQSPYSSQTFAKVTGKHKSLSVSTSGTYRRYATIPSEHHLINPKTASQGREFVSVSLFTTANNAKIDAYATALSVMSKAEALAFVRKHNDIGFVFVDKEGKILYGNLTDLVEIEWLDYRENPTNPSISKNNSKNTDIHTTFIHPDTTSPKMIAK